MRLLFINRYFWPDESATAQLLSDLAFHLAERGHEVTILTGRSGYRNPSTLYPREESFRGVRILRRGGSRSGRVSVPAKVMDFCSFYWGLLPLLRRECRNADWLFSLTDPPLLSTFTDFLAGHHPRKGTWCMDLFPEIASLHSHNGFIRFVGGLLQRVRNRSFRHQEALIALGNDMAEHLVSQGLSRPKIRIIPNWAVANRDSSADVPSEILTPEALRKKLSLPQGFTIGYSGNLGRVHEPDTVARAIKTLPRDWSGQFLFFSFGRNLETLKGELGENPPPWVRFFDPQPLEFLEASLKIPDVHWFSLYPHFSKLVFPSKFAGILAAGKPTIFIGEATSEIARLIGQYQCGFTVAPGDVDGFIRAVNTLKQNPDLRTTMGEAAVKLYQAGFNRDRALHSWENLLASHP